MATEINPKENNTIVVAIDFSTAADNALTHATHIADHFGNEILLLYVLEESFFKSVFSGNVEKNILMDTVSKKLDERIASVKKEYPNLKIDKVVKEGKVWKQIVKTAESVGCDSIVMGFHGESAYEQFMGSTTSRVLKAAPVPVVIVKELASSTDYKKIILPIDLTKESRQKTTWAIHLAKKYNSEVHVIMEVEDDEFLKKKVRASLLQVEKLLAKAEVNFVSKLLDDQEYPEHFGKDIIKYSDEVEADLIMIMTQKETGLMDFFMGSFAREIIRGTSNIPIMCINPKETGSILWATETF